MDKKSILKLFYDWKIFLIVIVLYFIIEFLTTPAGGFSGFPLKTCPHFGGFAPQAVGGFAPQAECSSVNVVLNLFIYYIVLVIFSIIIKFTYYIFSNLLTNPKK